MIQPQNVTILNPSIDDYQKTVVIRGVLHLDTLQYLRTDFYQRELLPSTSRKNIRDALNTGTRLPDVVLGMRGQTFSMPDDRKLNLLDPVFIIDGQQRIKTVLELWPTCKHPIRLGAIIHINTDVNWERDLFQKLNQYQIKVSPNILLRNNKEDHPLITTLYGLTNTDRQFCLYNRVSWQQNMKKAEIISANMFLQTIMQLHSHLVVGARSTRMSDSVPASDQLVKHIGLPICRANIKEFFESIDNIWGIRRIQIKGGAPYMRSTFLQVFSRLISDHTDFWKGEKEQRLEFNHLIKRKLASFPISDPEIIRLAGAGGSARLTLYTHILNHINSGRRIHRLSPRKPSITFNIEDNEEEENTDAA